MRPCEAGEVRWPGDRGIVWSSGLGLGCWWGFVLAAAFVRSMGGAFAFGRFRVIYGQLGSDDGRIEVAF